MITQPFFFVRRFFAPALVAAFGAILTCSCATQPSATTAATAPASASAVVPAPPAPPAASAVAPAPAPASGNVVLLSSLDLSVWQPVQGQSPVKSSTQVPVMAEQTLANGPMTMAGVPHADGISTRAGAVLYLQLNGGSDNFSATVGVDDLCHARADGAAARRARVA
jgi:hypothetical protein